MIELKLRFLTPLFSRGSYDDRPEIRAASIRGQLHGWFRLAGGTHVTEKAVFGGVQGGATASKVVVRVADLPNNPQKFPTLPHKTGGLASPKMAFPPGASFHLRISERLGGLGANRETFLRALELWLLLGTLGLRATRAAGSFSWKDLSQSGLTSPTTLDAYEHRCRELINGTPIQLGLSRTPYESAEKARRIISDTLGGRDDRQGDQELARLNHPLGRVFVGRKTSPLRFRIFEVENQYFIAALWDNRTTVTGNTPNDRSKVIDLLAKNRKPIGRELQHTQWS